MPGAPTQIFEIPVDGGALQAELRESGYDHARPPVLFLHGWTLDRRMWAPQMEALSARYPVIAFDRRGFGRSTAPAGLEREAGDIAAILDALSIEACILVGMSQAGRVALDFALRCPECVKALVLQGAQIDGFRPAMNEAEAIPVDAYRDLARAGKLAELRKAWRAHPLMHVTNAKAGEIVDEILQDYDGRDLLAPASYLAVGPDALTRIGAPMLVVTGDQETVSRRLVADAIAEGAPNARRATIEKAGHLCNLCNPGQYNAVLEAFLDSLG
ncbi:alpha/beta fold hydrolase [Hyphococcus luteus]|uniref:AB hydrolase-1 domain-containing protein n=1 Tax=Hyphococcus luteus TaxID=2058213 RepID=A0A2S7KAL5_9PROT|nr:alpha/beta hydrolase [Marinicaulis flavus]PQA89560.1 hypothetical protein CW354_01430 [Marinicaulis flavus]